MASFCPTLVCGVAIQPCLVVYLGLEGRPPPTPTARLRARSPPEGEAASSGDDIVELTTAVPPFVPLGVPRLLCPLILRPILVYTPAGPLPPHHSPFWGCFRAAGASVAL